MNEMVMTSPDESRIVRWKARYGQIWSVELEEIVCFYHGLSALEYMAADQLREKMPDRDWNLAVARIGLLFPTAEDLELTGSLVHLTDLILDVTVPMADDLKARITEARQAAPEMIQKNFPLSVAIHMSSQMPGLNIMELAKLPGDYLLTLAAMVEQMTGNAFLNVFLKQTAAQQRRPAEAKKPPAEEMQIDPSTINTMADDLTRLVQAERAAHAEQSHG